MNTATPRIANGIVGLSMLAMFTVAIVAGQARANRGAALQTIEESSQMQPHRLIVVSSQELDALPPLAGHE